MKTTKRQSPRTATPRQRRAMEKNFQIFRLRGAIALFSILRCAYSRDKYLFQQTDRAINACDELIRHLQEMSND